MDPWVNNPIIPFVSGGFFSGAVWLAQAWDDVDSEVSEPSVALVWRPGLGHMDLLYTAASSCKTLMLGWSLLPMLDSAHVSPLSKCSHVQWAGAHNCAEYDPHPERMRGASHSRPPLPSWLPGLRPLKFPSQNGWFFPWWNLASRWEDHLIPPPNLWQSKTRDFVDGRNPANHLGCIEPCK